MARAPVAATVRPPGSKSQTIRALFAAGLASGTSTLRHPLDSDDTAFAREALRRLGVAIDEVDDTWSVTGCDGALDPSAEPLEAGASGLTARCLIATAALVDGSTTIVGRDRLPERPMAGLVTALNDLGIDARATAGRLPVTVEGDGRLPGGRVDVDSHQTTQFMTGLLTAAPLAADPMTITPVGIEGSAGYVDLTLETMEAFGAPVERIGGSYLVKPGGYTGVEIEIEPDASAAVYPMVAAAVTGGTVTIDGLGSRSGQPDLAIAGILRTMGCDVAQTAESTTVTSNGPLHPIDADLSASPDGSLAMAVACLFATGPSLLRGLGSLRYKESDRLTALATEISRLGARADIEGDTLIITPKPLRPAQIETYDDHRIAMSFALVGLVQPGIEISNPAAVNKTWPGYWDLLVSLAEPRN